MAVPPSVAVPVAGGRAHGVGDTAASARPASRTGLWTQSVHLTSVFFFLNLISLQITASGFSPQAQGLKRKANFGQRIGIQGGFTWLKEPGLHDVHHTACDAAAGVGDATVVSQWCPPSPPQSLTEQLVLLQQLESSLLNRSHPPRLVWAPELGWLLTCSGLQPA